MDFNSKELDVHVEARWSQLLSDISALPADFKAQLPVAQRFDGVAKDLGLSEIFASNPALRGRLIKCGGLGKVWEFCHAHWEKDCNFTEAWQRLLEDLQKVICRRESNISNQGCVNLSTQSTQVGTSTFARADSMAMFSSKEEFLKWLTREAHVEEHLRAHPAMTQKVRCEGGLCTLWKKLQVYHHPERPWKICEASELKRVKLSLFNSLPQPSGPPGFLGLPRLSDPPPSVDLPPEKETLLQMSAPPGLTTPQLLRIVREIWIVVGDEVLGVESSWQESVESWCNENHCHFRPISLRGNRVLHTAGAVSNIVASIDNGTFLAGSDCLGAAFQDFSVQGAYLHLVMSEYGWKDMPASAQEWAHVNRFDNINCTLRAFAVDGRSTKEIYGGNEKLLRNTFKGMYVVGRPNRWKGSCYMRMDPQVFAAHLCRKGTAALTEARLVREVWNSWQTWQSENGIHVSQKAIKLVPDILQNHATTGASTVVVILSPTT